MGWINVNCYIVKLLQSDVIPKEKEATQYVCKIPTWGVRMPGMWGMKLIGA